mmetsp:Transcript_144264/g.402076  ORF Transcript_144264/g.402076 Transcript_144264/m.402076 type:complete len:103 (+) Transcript_144264:214-522(+)
MPEISNTRASVLKEPLGENPNHVTTEAVTPLRLSPSASPAAIAGDSAPANGQNTTDDVQSHNAAVKVQAMSITLQGLPEISMVTSQKYAKSNMLEEPSAKIP